MRNKEEIIGDLAWTHKDKSNVKFAILEVLLDIRDLLDKQ